MEEKGVRFTWSVYRLREVTFQFIRRPKSGSQNLVGRRRFALQVRNLESQRRFRVNVYGRVQVNQLKDFVIVGVPAVLQLQFLDDSGLKELIFHLIKSLQKITC